MQKKIYLAREGAIFKDSDAQEIGEFIEKHNNKGTKEILEEIRKAKKHVIYSYIDWDDSTAAEKFRLQRVRNIIAGLDVQVVSIGDSAPRKVDCEIRAFHSVSEPTAETRIYVSTDETFDNEFYRQQIIDRAKTELENWNARYKIYQELSTISETIDIFLKIEKNKAREKEGNLIKRAAIA